jgi:kynureninase
MQDFSPADRFRFPDEPDAIELRAFTHGLQPATVPQMMEHFTEDWRRYGVDAWNEVPNHWRPDSGDRVGWWTLPTYLGDEFIAPLLGAPEGTCIHQPHVHWTVQCLLSAPEVNDRGDRVVVSDTAFPSVLHSTQQWDDLQDLAPAIVPSTAANQVDREALLDEIGPDTAMVALSHVGFTTGARLPTAFLQEVAETAHAHDALFLLDGYHAAGSMPVDVEELGCDLYVGGLLKEACGSSGNAFLYVRDGLELTPRLTGWFGDAAPFAFRPEPEPHPDVRRRFLGGTTNVASMYHAVEGVRILLDVGLDAVHAHSLDLTQQAIERADEAGLPLRSPRDPDARSAMVLLEVPEAEKLTAHLKAQAIYTDSRQNEVVRMAPFLWNTAEEVHRTFDQIEDALSTNSYREASVASSGPVT